MKIVLRADVEHLGQQGRPRRRRRRLRPQFPRAAGSGPAGERGDPEAGRRDAARTATHAIAASREAAQAVADQLTPTVQIEARAGEGGRLFGSVTSTDIAAAVLAQIGIEVDRRHIALDEPLKELGVSERGRSAPPEVTATFRVEVVAG